ncbi:hypothetical protein Slala02_63990 [Streptomyces lavendulae subsp. lavendulae]|nr:hypothetical protein Slala01_67610 [Streptomyces lavendulae subsp. lavendulae]GLX30579.1 hypothetical protein Slala02_63990 [Streptomyces lavendulae subsp. lavendulae]
MVPPTAPEHSLATAAAASRPLTAESPAAGKAPEVSGTVRAPVRPAGGAPEAPPAPWRGAGPGPLDEPPTPKVRSESS